MSGPGRGQWAPQPPSRPPRARHPQDNMDRRYLQTAAYTTNPRLGKVYCWEQHHKANQLLWKQKLRQERVQEMADALRKEARIRETNDVLFKLWCLRKDKEKGQRLRRNEDWLAALAPRTTMTAVPAGSNTAQDEWAPVTRTGVDPIGRVRMIRRPGVITNLPC